MTPGAFVLAVALAGAGPVALTPEDAARRALDNAVVLEALGHRVDEENAESTLGQMLRNPEVRMGDFRSDRLINPLFTGGGYDRALEDTEFGIRVPAPRLRAFGLSQSTQGRRVAARQAVVDQEKNLIVREAHRLHAELRNLRARIDLAEEQVALSTRIHDLLQRRFAAQLATGLDVSVAALDANDAQADLSRLQVEARSQEVRLRYLVGLPADTPLELTAPPADRCREVADSAEQTLVDQAVQVSPVLAGISAERDAAAAAYRETFAGLIPWFDFVQAGFTPGSSQEPWSVRLSLSIDLPLLNFSQDDFARYAARERRHEAELRHERLALEADVHRAAAELAGQRAIMDFYTTTAAPTLDGSERQIEAALQEGQGDPVDMAILRARILRAKRAQLRAALECEQAALNLDAMTGTLLSRTLDGPQ